MQWRGIGGLFIAIVLVFAATLLRETHEHRRTADIEIKTTTAAGRAATPVSQGREAPALEMQLLGKRNRIGLEREVEIRIRSDRVLLGEIEFDIPVANDDTTERLVTAVETGIERAVEKWGEPPGNFYWLPTVSFVVCPGGSDIYKRLHGRLERVIGTTASVRYVSEDELLGEAAIGKSN